jgi:large subunit ribosomal protein L13
MTTFTSKEDAQKDRKWLLVDVAGMPVGRAATQIATLLRGKHKPSYTPHVDDGDFVIVVNAEKVRFTGKKLDQKIYYSHSTFPGGLKSVPAKRMLEEHPERVIRKAVVGMLPSGPLGYQLEKKLKVYTGSDHPHTAQAPEVFELKGASTN